MHYSAVVAAVLYFVPTRVFSWYKYAIVFILTFIVFKLNIVLAFLSTLFGILQVDGRYLNYLSDVDSVNMTGVVHVCTIWLILHCSHCDYGIEATV